MSNRMRTLLWVVFAIGTLLLGSAAGPGAPAVAAPRAPSDVSFTVNNANDVVADFTNDSDFTVCHTAPANNICTLRAAVMNANRHFGGATILLPAGTYFIQLPPTGGDDDDSGDLDLKNAITLIGAGPASTIIDAGSLDGVFDVFSSSPVTITGVTIRNGRNGKFLVGGGIDVNSRLHLSDSTLSHNFAQQGGGALWVGAPTTLDRVTVADNGPVAIINSSSLTVTNSSLYDNDGGDSSGGAIENFDGHLTVFNSTFSNNRTQRSGGAIDNGGTATILASTFAGNLADDLAQGFQSGGAIYNEPLGSLLMANTLLADNFVSHTLNACSGTPITSLNYNDVQAGSGCAFSGTTTNNIEPAANLLLGPLADNGGPTLTRALFPGNPAVDQIPPAVCRDLLGAAPVPDQRGVARPIGPQCDIGAYEGAPALAPYFRNLVVNGDAESSPGSPSGAWVGAAGWFVKSGQFTVVPYNANGFPSVPTDTARLPANRGLNFFAGGRVSDSLAAQVITLPTSLAASFDAGAVTDQFSADLGGFLNQDDNAVVSLRFQDSGLHTLGPLITIGPITSTARGDLTGFVHVSNTGLVPAHATLVVVDVTMTRVFTGGSYDDAYVDNISFVLLPKAVLYLPLMRHG